ncbi:MAG: hypothetical protein WCJ81_08660 [bacterium]
MSKKEFVLQILTTLQGKWSMAKDITSYINQDLLDNEAINALVELFRQMATYVKDDNAKQKLLKAATMLENLKQLEMQDIIQEQQEADNLLLSL